VGKISILLIPIFGLFYYLMGHILLNRKDKMGSKNTLNRLGEELKRKNLSLWIMPEGTRNRGQKVLPFKKGAFYLAVNTGLPIIPVAISNYHKGLDFNRRKTGTVFLKALPFIETKRLGVQDVKKLSQDCRENLIREIDKLDEYLMRDYA
jgi:1-acyl-sn-glycerol-3-phosphate acyltransferase